jgi:hypothetical protein
MIIDELEKRMSKLEEESNMLKLKADTLQQRISEIDIDKEARQLWVRLVVDMKLDPNNADDIVDDFFYRFKNENIKPLNTIEVEHEDIDSGKDNTNNIGNLLETFRKWQRTWGLLEPSEAKRKSADDFINELSKKYTVIKK